jgi:hypothetical protein
MCDRSEDFNPYVSGHVESLGFIQNELLLSLFVVVEDLLLSLKQHQCATLVGYDTSKASTTQQRNRLLWLGTRDMLAGPGPTAGFHPNWWLCSAGPCKTHESWCFA